MICALSLSLNLVLSCNPVSALLTRRDADSFDVYAPLFFWLSRFLSDSMGQEPLIDDETCTTRLPADVDEEAFLPSSTSLPLPRPQCNSAYFIQKCRYVELLLYYTAPLLSTYAVSDLDFPPSILTPHVFPFCTDLRGLSKR